MGYLGSSNWVNELNLVEFLKLWVQSEVLRDRAELVLGGGVCTTLANFAPPGLVARAAPRMLGRVADLAAFFAECDLFINPERGGTGIKIKSLDALAYGVPLLATAAGAVGIGSASRYHDAPDLAALIGLAEQVAARPEDLAEVAADSGAAQAAYVDRHRNAMAELLGPIAASCRYSPPVRTAFVPPTAEPVTPAYVAETAAPYHHEEFLRVWQSADVVGKRVLEVGSDYHLASARLFSANGASEVIATNLGNWISSEPLPDGVRFIVGDVSDAADTVLEPASFDIIYGIAVLEHIPDLDRVARAAQRLLKPGGMAYFQGCPLWPGAIGHHVWLSREALEGPDPTALNGLRKDMDIAYSFAEDAKNPIPHWAHLTCTPDELTALLERGDVPARDAAAISHYVYNCDGQHTGISSNFKAASEIIAAFSKYFDVTVLRDEFRVTTSEYYQAALAKYDDLDLATLGLRLFLTHKGEAENRIEGAAPAVSVIVPFFGVQDFIAACLTSIVDQDFADFEVILVDDASTDGSRQIAEGFAARDDRFRIVTHAVNMGLGPARNTGVGHAGGEFLLFLDSDDLLAGPEALGRLVATARRTGCEVVAGSSDRLLPDGQRVPFDRMHDERAGGRPGETLTGIEAFQGAMYVPGGGYLPMRAWGTLISRRFYQTLGHEFPAGEHEDLPHTPILYFRANGVHYDPATVVLYRDRSGGLSRNAWSPEKLRRYQSLWDTMRRGLEKHGPEGQTGDAALKFAEHLVWKLAENGLHPGAEGVLAETLSSILLEAAGATNERLAGVLLNALEGADFVRNEDRKRLKALYVLLPPPFLISHYRRRLSDLGGTATPLAVLPKRAAVPVLKAAPPTPVAQLPDGSPTEEQPGSSDAAVANQDLSDRILADYNASAGPQARNFPAMLTHADKAIYFHAGKTFGFRGAIVDAGCFVGGTTINLVEGLHQNPAFVADPARAKGLIRVYDLFQIDDDYILHHLEHNYPEHDFRGQKSYLPIFRKNLAAHATLLDVRPGDLTATGYHDTQPIEILGVDLCRSRLITDFVVRTFFPRLLPKALVLQQDFVHEFHPHIHLSMLRLEDHFEPFVELKWGGTVAFKLRRPITTEIIRARFGRDTAWYRDTAGNVPMLRRMIETAHYDENRWVFLLTLGIYLADCGDMTGAHETYREACTRFPAFEPSDMTRKMIGN